MEKSPFTFFYLILRADLPQGMSYVLKKEKLFFSNEFSNPPPPHPPFLKGGREDYLFSKKRMENY